MNSLDEPAFQMEIYDVLPNKLRFLKTYIKTLPVNGLDSCSIEGGHSVIGRLSRLFKMSSLYSLRQLG